MFNILKNVFGKSRTKLYFIEIDDEKINKEMSSLIVRMEQEITQFRKTIDETTWEVKDGELLQLFEEMTNIKKDVSTIQKDVDKIVGMKLENMKYFIIKDDKYLTDKKQDLEMMESSINSFLQIVEQRPSHDALKKNLIEELLKQLNQIQELTRKIVTDDINLQTIYRKINQV